MCLYYHHLPLCGHGPGVLKAGPFCQNVITQLNRINGIPITPDSFKKTASVLPFVSDINNIPPPISSPSDGTFRNISSPPSTDGISFSVMTSINSIPFFFSSRHSSHCYDHDHDGDYEDDLNIPFRLPGTCDPIPGRNVLAVLDRTVGACGGYCSWECRNSGGIKGLWTQESRMGMPGATYGKVRDGVGWTTTTTTMVKGEWKKIPHGPLDRNENGVLTGMRGRKPTKSKTKRGSSREGNAISLFGGSFEEMASSQGVI